MATTSTIEWTESTWNPIVGCQKVSEGCRHCYAETKAKRLAAMAKADEVNDRTAGRKTHYLNVLNNRGKWNGKVALVEEAVDDPRKWRQPRVIFVNSMSDLFHKDVPLWFIQRVFDTMNACPQHTFQLLTKRPKRALELASELTWSENIWMGTSVEDAKVIERIDYLRVIPTHVRFLSLEPLLGPLHNMDLMGIHWVIAGGESGPGARPMDPD